MRKIEPWVIMLVLMLLRFLLNYVKTRNLYASAVGVFVYLTTVYDNLIRLFEMNNSWIGDSETAEEPIVGE
jgi:hypothetical protein